MPPHLVGRQGGGLAALVAAVELRAVGQGARVVALARGVLGRVHHAAEVELKTDFRQQQQQQQQRRRRRHCLHSSNTERCGG